VLRARTVNAKGARSKISSIPNLNLSKKEGWEAIYVFSILPGEDGVAGYGCINRIDILKNDMPWKAFGLDPKAAKVEDIKSVYRELCKQYHPDIPETCDARIFERLTIFYKRLMEKF
jgi:hypothetical protein